MAGKVGYPAEVYRAAFELWAFVFDGNGKKTADRLAAEGTPVPLRTVQYWASQHDWEAKKRDELRTALPGIHRLNLAHLVHGSLEGFRTLREIARHDDNTIDAAHNRNRITASIALIDRAGYATRHDSGAGQHRPNLPALAADLDMSDDDLAAALLGYYQPDALPTGERASDPEPAIIDAEAKVRERDARQPGDNAHGVSE